MPELPEVEVIRQELAPLLAGRRFTAVDARLKKMVLTPLGRFRRAVVGSRITAVRRRAKLLLLDLSSGWTVAVHLKMTGQLVWVPERGTLRGGGHPFHGALDGLPNRYSHIVFTVTGGQLIFNDLRQFGFLKLVRTDALERWFAEQKIGPEPLERFPFATFNERLQRRPRSRVKPTLLDQRFVAGLGNIYADEALFEARVRPTRLVRTLTVSERRALWQAIPAVLRRSLRHRGTTFRHFRRPDGQPGAMLRLLRVYGREGQPCRRCGTPIQKTRLAQRGTHACPNCQR